MRKIWGAFKSLAAIFFMVSVLSGGVYAVSSFAEGTGTAGTPNDVSAKIDIKLRNMYVERVEEPTKEKKTYYIVKDEAVQTPVPDIVQGDKLEIKYRWDVADTTGIKNGDYFTINIPNNTYLRAMEVSSPVAISIGSESIGSFTIAGGVLTAVFNEKIETVSGLSDGYFDLWVKAESPSDSVRIQTAGADVTIKIVKPAGGSSGSTQPPAGGTGIGKTEDNKMQGRYAYKQGKQESINDIIAWEVRANENGYAEFIKSGNAAEVLNNVIIEDKLGDRMEPVLSEFKFMIPIYYPTENGTLSTTSYENTDIPWTVSERDVVVWRSTDGTYAEFREAVKKMSPFTVGVYYGEYSTNIAANLGSLPGNGITYMEAVAKKYNETSEQAKLRFENKVNENYNSGKITLSQRDTMLLRHSRENSVNGQVLHVRLEFKTNQKAGNGTYTNKASVSWDAGNRISNEYGASFRGASGGISVANVGEVLVKKLWYEKSADNSGNVLISSTDKLQKVVAKVNLYRTTEGLDDKTAISSKTLAYENDFEVKFLVPKQDSVGRKYQYTVEEENSSEYTLIGYEEETVRDKLSVWTVKNLYTPVESPTVPGDPTVPSTPPAVVSTPPAVVVDETEVPKDNTPKTDTKVQQEDTPGESPSVPDSENEEGVDIDEDGTARGDTEVGEDKSASEEDITVSGDNTPKDGIKVNRLLAKTGGERILLLPSLFAAGLLLSALCIVNAAIKKTVKRKNV